MSLENDIVDYETNKEDIEHWTLLKGEYRYKEIIKFLNSYNIENSWENISNYIRYDKRLLVNSFKYIVVLEELYKSFVVRIKGRKNTKVLSSYFQNAYNEFLSLKQSINYDDIDLETMEANKEVINSFRNKVVHNKILINRTFDGKTLQKTLEIFIRILPASYRRGFIKDINACAKGLVEDKWHVVLSAEE